VLELKNLDYSIELLELGLWLNCVRNFVTIGPLWSKMVDFFAFLSFSFVNDNTVFDLPI